MKTEEEILQQWDLCLNRLQTQVLQLREEISKEAYDILWTYLQLEGALFRKRQKDIQKESHETV